jgi:hypothetical protein
MVDIITMPDSLYMLSSQKFTVATLNTTSGPSSVNPLIRVDGPSAQIWQVEMTFVPRQEDDLDELHRFVMRLKGGKVLARLYDASRQARTGRTQPRGAGGATSTVNVLTDAVAGSETIQLKNLLPGQAKALASIDHLGIGENLHAIVVPGPSDGSGQGGFTIWPPLRKGVAVNDPVNLVLPTGLFQLTGGSTDLTVGGGGISQPLTLTFVESPDFDA